MALTVVEELRPVSRWSEGEKALRFFAAQLLSQWKRDCLNSNLLIRKQALTELQLALRDPASCLPVAILAALHGEEPADLLKIFARHIATVRYREHVKRSEARGCKIVMKRRRRDDDEARAHRREYHRQYRRAERERKKEVA
jgi:hypothetical protein